MSMHADPPSSPRLAGGGDGEQPEDRQGDGAGDRHRDGDGDRQGDGDRAIGLSVRAMLGAGLRDLRAYPRLFACLYLVQLALSGGAAWLMALLMTSAWGRFPELDHAAAGDAAALVFLLRDGHQVLAALFWIMAGTVMLYVALSWYLAGGLNAVLLARPTGARDTARGFGAGGALTFPAYLRLALLSLIPYVLIAVAAGIGIAAAADGLQYALTLGDLLAALAPALLPALLLWWLHGTAVAYARIALSRGALADQGRTGRLAVARALVRAYGMVLTCWPPLAQVLLHALWFTAVSALFAGVAWHMSGAGAIGAVALFALRQTGALLRGAGAFALAGGQVAFTRAPARSRNG